MPATPEEVGTLIAGVARVMEERAGELRSLDAAIGDGDLGLTFTLGARAIRQTLNEIREGEVSTLLAECGAAFANANPSTMGALIGAGLQAAAGTVKGRWTLEMDDLVRMGRAAAEAITARGGANLGDKTILDALSPSIVELQTLGGQSGLASCEIIRRMIAAAEEGAAEVDDRRSRIGRASWLGERSRGHRDPGAQSWIIILEAMDGELNHRMRSHATCDVTN